MADLDFEAEEFWVLTDYVREYPGATRDGKQHKLWISAKRLKPVRSVRMQERVQTFRVNVIFAGGNGFPKVCNFSRETSMRLRVATGAL